MVSALSSTKEMSRGAVLSVCTDARCGGSAFVLAVAACAARRPAAPIRIDVPAQKATSPRSGAYVGLCAGFITVDFPLLVVMSVISR